MQEEDCNEERVLDFSDEAIASFIAESRALLLEAGIDISDAERLTSETSEISPPNNSDDIITLDDDDDDLNNIPTASTSASEIICIDDSIIFAPTRVRNSDVIDLCSPSSPKRGRLNSDRKPVRFVVPAPPPPPKPVEAPPQNLCPVCLDDYKKNGPTATACGHIFCGPCIRQCVQTYKKCPSCNKKLNGKQLIKLYL